MESSGFLLTGIFQSRFFRWSMMMGMVGTIFYSCTKTDEEPSPAGSDRDKFLGVWLASANGTSGASNYNMTITAGASSSSQILMDNFENFGAGTKVIATVSGNDIAIPGAPTNIIGQDTISGNGTFNSGTLSLHYTIRDGQTVDVRTASAHK